jgi:hypothetical protein
MCLIRLLVNWSSVNSSFEEAFNGLADTVDGTSTSVVFVWQNRLMCGRDGPLLSKSSEDTPIDCWVEALVVVHGVVVGQEYTASPLIYIFQSCFSLLQVISLNYFLPPKEVSTMLMIPSNWVLICLSLFTSYYVMCSTLRMVNKDKLHHSSSLPAFCVVCAASAAHLLHFAKWCQMPPSSPHISSFLLCVWYQLRPCFCLVCVIVTCEWFGAIHGVSTFGDLFGCQDFLHLVATLSCAYLHPIPAVDTCHLQS